MKGGACVCLGLLCTGLFVSAAAHAADSGASPPPSVLKRSDGNQDSVNFRQPSGPPRIDKQVQRADFQAGQTGQTPPTGSAAGSPESRGGKTSPAEGGNRNSATGRATKLDTEESSTRKTGGPQSAVDPAVRAAAVASAELLSASLAPRANLELAGEPLPLIDALSGRGAPSERLAAAQAYWRLSLAVAEYNLAVDESRQLDAQPEPATKEAIDPSLLATARAAAQSRMVEAQASAIAAQEELAQTIARTSETLPLPIDQPLVGTYRTEFSTLFAARPAPLRLRAIHRLLPIHRAAIDSRTAAVQAAATAVRSAEAAYQQGTADMPTLLACHEALARQRREFLKAVLAYNQLIAEYAMQVAEPAASAAVLVGMLTRTRAPSRVPPSANSSARGGGIRIFAEATPTPADPALDPDVQAANADGEWTGDSPQETATTREAKMIPLRDPRDSER